MSSGGAIACPRCGASVGDDHDWCLRCGAAARTRLVPTPNWRAPLGALAVIAVVACIALAAAFVALTNEREAPAPTTPPAPTAAPGS